MTVETYLLSNSDIRAISGWAHSNKQAEWFRKNYGVDVVRAAGGRIVMTWPALEAMQAKRNGITAASQAPKRLALRAVGGAK